MSLFCLRDVQWPPNLRNQDQGKNANSKTNLTSFFPCHAPVHTSNGKEQKVAAGRPQLGGASASLTGLGTQDWNTGPIKRSPAEHNRLSAFPPLQEPETNQSSQSLKASFQFTQDQSNCTIGHCHKFHKQEKGQRK